MSKLLTARKAVSSACLLAFASTAALAEESYQTEAEFYFTKWESESDSTQDTLGLILSHYLTPVEIKDHPHTEAAFLERVASFNIAIEQSDRSVPSLNPDLDARIRRHTVGYAHMQPNSNVYADISLEQSTLSFLSPYGGDSRLRGYTVSLGGFLTAGWLTFLSYGHQKEDAKLTLTGYLPYEETTKYDSLTLTSKYVAKLEGGAAYNLVFSATQEKEKDSIGKTIENTFSLASTYYVDRNTGIGLALGRSAGTHFANKTQTLALKLSTFVTSDISLALFMYDIKARERNDSDSQIVDLKLAARF